MVGCLPCRSGFKDAHRDNDAKWTPDLVRDLYRKCMASNNGQLIVYGALPAPPMATVYTF